MTLNPDGLPERQRQILAALAVVTDFVHRTEQPDLADTELGRIVLNDELNDEQLVFGLVNLCQILLVKLERTGQEIDAVLADIGVRYRRTRPTDG